MRYAELKPQLPVLSFLPRSREKTEKTLESTERPMMNTSRPRSIDLSRDKARANYQTDIFDGDDLEFDDLLVAGTSFDPDNTSRAHSSRSGDRLGLRRQ